MDWKDDLSKRIIIDNGSNQIRYGSCTDQNPQLMLNLVANDKKTGQQYQGEILQNMIDESNLIYYKQQVRGVVVDWDNEIQLWEKLLKDKEKQIQQSCLTLTYHPGQPYKVRERMLEVAFDYFHFDSFYPALSQSMVREYYMGEIQELKQLNPHFQLVVESTHSATYIVPFFDSEPINYAIKRLDIGGKILTKYLLDIINMKYIQLKNEIRMTQQIKEQMCYVSKQFQKDMKMKPGSHFKYFILPDFDTGKKGFVTDALDTQSYAQYLPLDKERYMIPEILFNPSDISKFNLKFLGLQQNGLSQSILDCVQLINPDIREYFLENIILSGGNSLFENLVTRLYSDLRQNTPQYLETQVNHIKEINATFYGCQEFCLQEDFVNNVIKKQDYKEYGFDRLNKLYFY